MFGINHNKIKTLDEFKRTDGNIARKRQGSRAPYGIYTKGAPLALKPSSSTEFIPESK